MTTTNIYTADPADAAQSSRPDVRNQRFLVIASLFPPDIMGGAEVSAFNLARWLREQGGEVGVLTTAKIPTEACEAKNIDGLTVWRVWMPRARSQFSASGAKWWEKIIWHVQDHVDPRNRTIVARVIDAFRPDFINIHIIQGIGYNALREIATRRIPTTFFLHDLGLACFRMGMFKNGRTCKRQCMTCKISAAYKLRCLRKIDHLRFASPSQANLDILGKYFPLRQWPTAAMMNANRYPLPRAVRTPSDCVRILYVGRLHVAKGVDILLAAAHKLSASYKLELTIIGSGPDEAKWRDAYGGFSWCRFTGFISQQEISDYMANSDMLCIPSVWAENSPGVVIHALSLGLPVMGSDKGGIPELVEDGKNGLLVPAGDTQAWMEALRRILSQPTLLDPWRAYAVANARKFDQDYLGTRILRFIQGQP